MKKRHLDAKQTSKVKKLDEYKQTKPEQLDMFQILLPSEKRFSNTIELYDFMPKYYYGKPERVDGTFLKSLVREFECAGIAYKADIKPASIRDSKGVERYYYPSKREELVEDALRKLAAEGQGVFLDDQAGVTFSLYQLQQELKRNGHNYNIKQIKDALMICAHTNIVVTPANGGAELHFSLFETLGLQSRDEWKGQGQKSRAFVRFNLLVTKSIKDGSFRLYDYETSMAYKSNIARQLHKRMSHRYKHAHITNTYDIMLTTIIRDFGLTQYEWLSHNLRDVQTALNEMTEKNIIMSYKVQKTLDPMQRNRMIDAKITITPHPKFCSDIIHANKRKQSMRSLRS